MKLLFLHAAGSSGDEWVQQRLAFAGEREVATPDLPGHGRNTAPPLATIPDMAAWVLTAQGDLDSTVVVGHSMGAAIAIALAASRRPRGLVLVGASAPLRVPAGFVEAVGHDAGVAVERLATRGFAASARPTLVEKASTFMRRTDPAVLRLDFAAGLAFDPKPLLARIAAPTLVVVGAEDRMTTPEDARAVAAAIRGARLAVVDGAGHMVMLERPRELNDEIRRFLDTL